MGSSSKAKANKAGVAKSTRAVLGRSRAVKQRAASSSRSKAKAKTKTKAKASKAKSKAEVFTVEENVAKPSYYPKDMMEFIVHQELSFLEGSILKRLVRLENKDKPSDLKKLKEEFFWFFPKIRTQNKAVEMMESWTELCVNHENSEIRNLKLIAEATGRELWEMWEETHVNFLAQEFVSILCSSEEGIWDKLSVLRTKIQEQLNSLTQE